MQLHSCRVSSTFTFAAALALAFVGSALPGGRTAFAGAATALHSIPAFVSTGDGVHYPEGLQPRGELLKTSDGSLWGVVSNGDFQVDGGYIFQITPDGTFALRHRFPVSASTGALEGAYPRAGLVEGTDGYLYGTTAASGPNDSAGPSGGGTIYKTNANGDFQVLHSFGPYFGPNTDGAGLYAPLARGTDGAFYGVAPGGGDNRTGTAFRITNDGAFSVLHTFSTATPSDPNDEFSPYVNDDGLEPSYALVLAHDGNLYGTTAYGGVHGQGTLFKIAPNGTFSTVYSFHQAVDFRSASELVEAADGVFYGTDANGSARADTVFRLATDGTAAGTTVTTIHTFTPPAPNEFGIYVNADGMRPRGRLLRGSDGALYGTASDGGAGGTGVVYRIITDGTPAGTQFTTLHSFDHIHNDENFDPNLDGAYPWGGVIFGEDGALYGTALGGGAHGLGAIFKLGLPAVDATVPGSANPYLAGQPGGTAGGGDAAPGQSPIRVPGLNLPGTESVSFTVTGSVDAAGGTPVDPADGAAFLTRGPENGFAGFTAPRNALLGVFVDESNPVGTTPPADLDFSSTGNVAGGLNFTTLSPALRQVFFIGNGVGTAAALQKFNVPTGATRLYLATSDSSGWHDNTGSFTVHVVATPPPPPAPHLFVPILLIEDTSIATVIAPAALLHFKATELITLPGLALHVQYATSADPAGPWTNLQDGNGGLLAAGLQPHEFVLDTTSYPKGQAIHFRVTASATGVADQVSDPIGPFDLVPPVPQLTIYEEALDAEGHPTTSVGVGGSITYKIWVVNTGTAIAKKLSVRTIIPDTNLPTLANPSVLKPAQFADRDLKPSLGGILYDTDQTDADGKLLRGIKWDGFGDLKPGFQQFVSYTVSVSRFAKVPGTIGNENRYSVSSHGVPVQPAGVFTLTTNNRPLLHTDVRLPIEITAVAVPPSGTIAPGALLRYDFTIRNLASTVNAGAVAVIDLPVYTRLAGYYNAAGHLVAYPPGVSASVIHHINGPDQLLVIAGSLNPKGKANSMRIIRLALQVQYVDPSTIPGGQIMTLDYAAAFVSTLIPKAIYPLVYKSPYQKLMYAQADPNGLQLAAKQAKDPSIQLASDINFATFLGDASNASAFTKNDSGILKTTVSGAFDQAPRLTLIKAFGANPLDPDDNLQSEDQGDGTTVNVSEQGHSVTYILSVLNTGPTTAEGVQIEDTVPVGMNVNAFDLVAAGNGNTGTRLLRAGFVRVLSKTPSALGLVPHAELGADHTLRIAGLRVKPGDYLVVSYTIDVSSEGIDAPAPGTMIHQFRASVSAENLPDNDGSLSFGDDLELKINGLAQVAEPQYEPGGIIPFVTHDLAASKAALNAIFGRKADAPVIVAGTHPHALPLVPGSNPPRFVPGFYRYDVKYQNLGTGAATAVQLTVPLPANTTLYRTAFVTKLASGVKQIDLSHAGNSFSVINGVPTFAFSKINAHTTGYVRMEVIVGVGAIDFNGSLVDLPFPYIQGNAAPRVAAKAEVPGRTTANATAPPPPIPFRANGLLARLAAYDASLIPPSLGIWKIVPQYVRKDELFTIQLIVMNAGAFDEDALYVRMKIPPHTAFVSADAGYTGAAEIVNAAGEHYVSLPLGGNNEAMPNGHARPVRAHEAGALTVTLRATEPGTFVENTAYMQSSYREPVYAQPATVTILGPDDPNPKPKALSSFITGLQVVNLPHQSSNVVPLGGGYVVAQGGGNVVSQGGGNVVSQGGGNIVAQGGGNIVVFGASSSISINPGAGVISVSSLLQPGMLSSLLKSQAINLLLPQAANLIGQDGGTLIGNDGGTLVGGGFSSLLANTRALIVAQGGGNIISHDGGSIISHDGGSVVAQGGGNVVSQGGGNIIVVGGASVVSQGGGNLIALPNSIGLIGQDGGTLVGAASAGVVSQGGGN